MQRAGHQRPGRPTPHGRVHPSANAAARFGLGSTSSHPERVIALQRTIGNRATLAVIQRKNCGTCGRDVPTYEHKKDCKHYQAPAAGPVGYDPIQDLDLLYEHYQEIGGVKERGNLQTVCTEGKKAGGHYTTSDGVRHEMRHTSHGAEAKGQGNSVTAWVVAHGDGWRVVGVGYHQTKDTYVAIFPRSTSHNAQQKNMSPQPEVNE